MTGLPQPIAKPAEPWRQRLVRSLLYGRNVNRAAKARARVGFAILAFAAIYAVIGGVAAAAHGSRDLTVNVGAVDGRSGATAAPSSIGGTPWSGMLTSTYSIAGRAALISMRATLPANCSAPLPMTLRPFSLMTYR